MEVEEVEFEDVKEYLEAPKPLILTTRKFRRTAPLGMHVWRSATRNFDYGVDIEHVEIGCPGYKLSDRGPVHKEVKKDD